MSESLIELYERKQNFPHYRAARKLELQAEDGGVNSLQTQLKALKEERRVLLARIDHKIAGVKLELFNNGVPTSPTERNRQIDAKLRDEKRELDEQFAAVVNARTQRGESIADLVKECGATQGAVFYAAASQARAPQAARVEPTRDLANEEWAYSNHSGVHRYALNQDMTLIKFHAVDAEDGFVVLTWPHTSYYSGDKSLVEKFDASRAGTLESILSGEYDGVVREVPNPYAGGN